jgi:aminotransferase
MKKIISNVLDNVQPSLLDSFFEKASEQKDVISLSVGEPDFNTPWHIAMKGIQAIQDGKTFYTPSMGLSELRLAISDQIKKKYNCNFPFKQILITNGVSEAIDIVLRSIIDCGDEVILTDPGYVSYEPCVILSRGIPVHLELEEKENFKITPQKLKSLITSKTKALIINYPNNPTGATMSKNELNEIARICFDNNIVVISDEIYSDLIYDGLSGSILNCDKKYLDNVIYINGLSKSYAMTGWRIGYIIANKRLIESFKIVHQYSTMCPSTISQYAGVEAIKNGNPDIEKMREEYKWRRNLLVSSLNSIGLPCECPNGAFYVFPSIKKYGMSSVGFCECLLERNKLAVIPGIAFGNQGENHIRISYAYSIDNLKEGLKRLRQFLVSLNSKL